ncbi:MAG: hypothetical protein LBT60_06750 [Oscillospiraceae bacterium]|jgi:hypothetical protein|nr:hypothetical protein [Oscillospiraceae bacterium]
MSFAETQARRVRRNALVVILVFVAAVAVYLAFFLPSPVNLYGARASFHSSSELEELFAARRFYVSATADELFDSGYTWEDANKQADCYYAFFAGEQVVICRSDRPLVGDDFLSFPVTGRLMAADDRVRSLIEKITQDSIVANPELSYEETLATFAPVYINMSNNRLMDQIFFGLLGLLLLFLLGKAVLNLTLSGDYTRGKPFKKLDAVSGGRAASINTAVTRALENGPFVLKSKYILITADWFVFLTTLGYQIFPTAELVWLYKSIVSRRASMTFSVQLRFRDGRGHFLPATRDNVDSTLFTLARAFPHALRGHSPELEKLFYRDRPQFLALAAQRAAEQSAEAAQPENAPTGNEFKP